MTGTLHIVVAMKPVEGNFAENVLKHGVVGLNIDDCRIKIGAQPKRCSAPGWDSVNAKNADAGYRPRDYQKGDAEYVPSSSGRWPANVIHDGSDKVVRLFPTTGVSRGGNSQHINRGCYGKYNVCNDGVDPGYGDFGSAARFSRCAVNMSRKETRNEIGRERGDGT